MKPIYCADSQDRIPIEFFSQGKAIWSGGKPYLRENAVRLRLLPDPMPPPEYLAALSKALGKEKPQNANQLQAINLTEPKNLASTQRGVVVPIKTPEPQSPPQPDLPKSVAKPPINMSLPSYTFEDEMRARATPTLPEKPMLTDSPPLIETLPGLSPEESAKLAESARLKERAAIKEALAAPAFQPPVPPKVQPAAPTPVIAKATVPPVVEPPKPVAVPPVAVKPPEPPKPVVDKPIAPAVVEPPKPVVAPPVAVKPPEPPKPVVDKPIAPAIVEPPKPVVAPPVAVKPPEPTLPVVDKPIAPAIVEPPKPVAVPSVAVKAPEPTLPVVDKPAVPPAEPAKPIAAAKTSATLANFDKPSSPTFVQPPKAQMAPAVAANPPEPPLVVAKAVVPPVAEAPKPVAAPTVSAKPVESPPLVAQTATPPATVAPKPVAAPTVVAKTVDSPPVVAKPVVPPAAQAPKPAAAPVVQAKPVEPPPVAEKPVAPPVAELPKSVVAPPAAVKAPASPAGLAADAPRPNLSARSGIRLAAVKAPDAPAKAAAPRPDEELEIQIPLQPGDPLSLEEMKQLEFLDGISDAVLKRLYGGIVRRTFKKGELICRQGDSASTAFYILSGVADSYILTPKSTAEMRDKAGKKKSEKIVANGLLERLKFWVQGRKEGPKKSRSGRRPIPNDGPIDLPPDTRTTELRAGELFGEMSCINFYPRSSTVRAKTDCVMVEMIRTIIDAVKEKGKYKEKLDKSYREKSLEQHLNSIPLFMDLDPEFIDELRRRVELQDFKPGQPIFKQGDAPDAFYLVRRGCIKVSQTQPGGELVLSYLGQNDYFGEIGVLRNTKRGATCTALDHVEVVKIKRMHFEFMIQSYDEFKNRLEKECEARLAMGRSMTQHAPTHALGEFLDQELMQAQNMLLIDLERCTRCDECVKACVDVHDDGITRLVREGLRFDKFLVASSCRSCMDPVCMIGCPVGSIRREATFEIIIEDWCIGCGKCAKQCPYGNIAMHDFPLSDEEIAKETARESMTVATKKKASDAAAQAAPAKENAKVGAPAKPAEIHAVKQAQVKSVAVTCDQCSTLREPSCVYACPHEAAMRVNAREFFDMGGKMALKEKGKSVKS